MKKITTLLLIFGLSILAHESFADTPLTSTDISKAYQNVPIVKNASKTHGTLTPELIKYLLNPKKPIDFKMALINELGWHTHGKANRFFEYLKKHNYYKSKEDFLKNGKAYELLSMAYLKALDDYFHVQKALNYANQAVKKVPKSYTYNIIRALIKAQIYMVGTWHKGNWCRVYKTTNKVRSNELLKVDMRRKAIKIIFNYKDLYKEDCK